MSKYLKVELDLFYDISDEKDILYENISETIVYEQESFYQLLGLVAGTQDSRAVLLEDTLEVHDIELLNSDGTATVTFDYDSYNGCKDNPQGGTVEEEWKFKLIGKKIIFNLLLPELDRTDEI